MKISDILKDGRVHVSLEVFPPKKEEGLADVLTAAEAMAKLRPSFMSVTYGAGGGTRKLTVEMADRIQREDGVTVLPHLTCISSDRARVNEFVSELSERKIENIMVLRGDIPKDGEIRNDYPHASDLIAELREKTDLCIGGACYPEGHVESANKAKDIRYLKQKADAGCDFLTTQMFFDNNIYYNFLYRIREAGITIPVLAGIMPITAKRQLARSVSLSGTNVPERFRNIVDHFGDTPAAMKAAGIIYASEQIIDLLANGIRHIHVYSMNKPEVAAGIMANLAEMLG